MKATRTELLKAIKEHVACLKEEKRLEKVYPMGTCNAEDTWSDFGTRQRMSDELLQKLAKLKR